MKIERWSSMQQYQQGSRLTYHSFDSISQPIEAPVVKAARDYLSRGRITRPIYIRETRCDPSPSRMILARSDSLSPFISLDAFYCFSSREDCLAPELELGGTISTIHAFRRGPSFFLSLEPNSALAPRCDEFYSDVKAKPGFRRAIQMTRKRQNGSRSNGTRGCTCWPRRDAISRPPHDPLPLSCASTDF